jgi:hypothetical protein
VAWIKAEVSEHDLPAAALHRKPGAAADGYSPSRRKAMAADAPEIPAPQMATLRGFHSAGMVSKG